MAAFSISPIAPAYVWTLVHPIGNVTEERFNAFVNRLLPEKIVRLSDISPDARSGRTTFSPLAFPSGVILYRFDTTRPVSPSEPNVFELFRRPLVVIGIVDAEQCYVLDSNSLEHRNAASDQHDFSQIIDAGREKLQKDNLDALIVQPVVFDLAPDLRISVSNDVLTVPPPSKSRSTTMKTVMGDISARLLSEMAVYAQTVQTCDQIKSPGPSTNFLISARAMSSVPTDIGIAGSTLSRPVSASSHRAGADDTSKSEDLQRPATAEDSALANGSYRSSSPVPRNSFSGSNSNLSSQDMNDISGKGPSVRVGISRLGRNTSRDRRSKQANALFTAERARQRLASRKGLVLGNLYLLAGRWPDALRELIVHAGRAKIFDDQIWYGKGLENMLVTMLLLAWARLDFAVPTICLPSSDRVITMKQTLTPNLVRSSQSIDGSGNGNERTRINLSTVIPELTHMILNSYRNDQDEQEDRISQFSLSQCIIRLSYLLAILRRSAHILNLRALAHLVQGTKWPSTTPTSTSLGSSVSCTQELSALLFEALPSELFSTSAPLSDTITILSGMIAVFSFAGLFRKRAMLIRETLSILIPKLIQARKVGAAELGIHPAASLAARHGLNIDTSSGISSVNQGQIEQGFQNLLTSLCDTYGVITNGESDAFRATRNLTVSNSQSNLPQLARDSQRRHFGGFGLKSEVLRLCANFSEALPNFADVILFTGSLIKTAGPGDAPANMGAISRLPISADEQKRFLGKIYRTLAVFKDVDATQVEVKYWDYFAVRDAAVMAPREEQAVTPRNVAVKPSNDVAADGSASGTFLHVPAQKPTTRKDIVSTVVVNEPLIFVVTLQNLYEFDLTIERLAIIGEAGTVNATATNFQLMPLRLQRIKVPGVVASTGDVRLSGCRLKIRGCREQIHHIYRGPWTYEQQLKIKRVGLSALVTSSQQQPNSADGPKPSDLDFDEPSLPAPDTTLMKVIDTVPTLIIENLSLLQNKLALMDGETHLLTLQVRNISKDVSINFVQISFEHTFAGEATIVDKKAAKEPMRCVDPQSGIRPIVAGSASSLTFEVRGAVGLVRSKIIIDYGHVVPGTDTTFYTRRASVSAEITVTRSLIVEGISVLPSDPVSSGPQHETGSTSTFILSIDLNNKATTRLVATIQVQDASMDEASIAELQPQERARLLVTTNLANLNKQENNDGQVESDLKPQPPSETDALNGLVTSLCSQWIEPASDRKGRIDLSQVPIDSSALHTTISQRVDIDITLTNSSRDIISPISPPSHFTISRNEPAVLKASIRNSTDHPVKPIIHFSPRVPGNPWVDISSCLQWSGALESYCKKLDPNEVTEVLLGLCATSEGVFDVEVLATLQRPERLGRASTSLGDERNTPAHNGARGGAATVLGSALCTLKCVSDLRTAA